MTALHDFNQQRYEDALAHILPCVAIPAWAEALVRGRPQPGCTVRCRQRISTAVG
jgi:2-oxo-4-hydroxy-4-carboxy-5-ureidoimidazoline decarboxylase